MIKTILLVAIVCAGIVLNNVYAQDATLTVNLAALQSIRLNTASVSIRFLTEADYANGKSSGAIADQIEIISTGQFTVSVKASGPLSAGTTLYDIPLTALTLTPALSSSSSAMTGQAYSTISGTLVKDVPQVFVKATSGTFNAKFSVNYGIMPGVGSVNVINRPVGDYVTTITYTISPD